MIPKLIAPSTQETLFGTNEKINQEEKRNCRCKSLTPKEEITCVHDIDIWQPFFTIPSSIPGIRLKPFRSQSWQIHKSISWSNMQTYQYPHNNLTVSDSWSSSKIPWWWQVTKAGKLWPLPYIWNRYKINYSLTKQEHEMKPNKITDVYWHADTVNMPYSNRIFLPVSRTQKSPSLKRQFRDQ